MAQRQKLFSGQQPLLTTERMTLRPFTMDDVPDVQEFMDNKDFSSFSPGYPYPCEKDFVEEYISDIPAKWQNREIVNYAMVPHEIKKPIGIVGLKLQLDHDVAEIGYLLGVKYWGQGYATEAAKRILLFGFYDLDLQCIFGQCIMSHKDSENILKKLGMMHEGILRQRLKKCGKLEDILSYSILASEFHESQKLFSN